MATTKAQKINRLINQIHRDLSSAQRVLDSLIEIDKPGENESITYEEAVSAATSASQAAMALWKLAGLIDQQ